MSRVNFFYHRLPDEVQEQVNRFLAGQVRFGVRVLSVDVKQFTDKDNSFYFFATVLTGERERELNQVYDRGSWIDGG